jgi:DNA mismatch endonuclease (patch repair protein)
MVRQRRRDTGPEIAIRRAAHARGLRYRVCAALPGTRRSADLLFTRAKVAVFVDGCFWHGCPEHGTQPKRNASWWADKIATNVRRDRDTDSHLAATGWEVVRIWSHEPAEQAVDRIAKTVARRKLIRSPSTARNR